MNSMDDEFWSFLDKLVSENRIVIDQPKGRQHPRYPDLVYPLDYAYLEGTTAGDGAGIDVWLGASGTRNLSAVTLTVDLLKRDAEVKLMFGCSAEETKIVVSFLNGLSMRATALVRPTKNRGAVP
jgi:inorganic pyrophosphatase